MNFVSRFAPKEKRFYMDPMSTTTTTPHNDQLSIGGDITDFLFELSPPPSLRKTQKFFYSTGDADHKIAWMPSMEVYTQTRNMTMMYQEKTSDGRRKRKWREAEMDKRIDMIPLIISLRQEVSVLQRQNKTLENIVKMLQDIAQWEDELRALHQNRRRRRHSC